MDALHRWIQIAKSLRDTCINLSDFDALIRLQEKRLAAVEGTPVLKVYWDNMVVSGNILGDLGDPSEQAAIRPMLKAQDEGRVEIFTSRLTHDQQGRARDEFVRLRLQQSKGVIAVVSDDHRLLGFHNQMDHLGTVCVTPIITDIVDQGLFDKLKATGLSEKDDAKHLMYAIHNNCDRFVTTDHDFFDRLKQLTPLCRGTKIVRPSELVAELSAS
jgi:hypothetical protein